MNHNLKKYFNNINFFFLFLISILTLISYFFNLSSTYIYIFCFLLIATIGVSHGAYDGIKGKMLFYKKFKIPTHLSNIIPKDNITSHNINHKHEVDCKRIC